MAFSRTHSLLAGSAAVAIAAATAVAVLPASASAAVATSAAGGHAYRHGVVPMLGGATQARVASPTANEHSPMTYHGGTDGVGVTIGKPKVYVIYWGAGWGTPSTDAKGYVHLDGDAQGMAPRQQAFFKGLGTNHESWSGVMTQYCQGVAKGAKSCPAGVPHIGYPTGGALAGVWADNSVEPQTASGHDLAAEAVRAAQHFGNTTAASNRNVQYVITSASGMTPDGFTPTPPPSGGFCAWHDFTGDAGMSGGALNSPVGDVAFTNMPYLPDAGANCGANFVNGGSAGALDGVTIVGSHEYAETVTDQFPYSTPSSALLLSGGWITDNDGTGGENGDKCAWVTTPGAMAFNLSLATGSFPVQTTWGNDANHGAGGCEGSHATDTGAPVVTIAHISNKVAVRGHSVRLAITAHDTLPGARFTYYVSHLPAGLHLNARTGVITGRPTHAGTYHVVVAAKDNTGVVGRTTFTWTIRRR